jgi:CRP-like cAMP-binding protein
MPAGRRTRAQGFGTIATRESAMAILKARPPTFKNRILASLPPAQQKQLAGSLTFLKCPIGFTLANTDAVSRHGYFLEEGMASAVVTMQDGSTVEVGVVGYEGVVGIPILLGTRQPADHTFMQIAGSGYRIDAAELRLLYERPGKLREHLSRVVHGFIVQTSQTAACNRVHSVEQRLARWLLTCRDRVDGDELHLTHDFLGHMLGATRATVTLAAGILQRAGLIRCARGRVAILNRKGLEAAACECYQTIHAEYRRLGLFDNGA